MKHALLLSSLSIESVDKETGKEACAEVGEEELGRETCGED